MIAAQSPEHETGFATQRGSRRLWIGLVLVCTGIGVAALYRFVIVATLCRPQANGTFGELYGPTRYFEPYVYVASAVLLVVGILFGVFALKRGGPNPQKHA